MIVLCLLDSAENSLRRRFRDLGLCIDSFSSLKYVGTQTVQKPTDFKCLLDVIESHLSDQSLRSSRPPGVVFQTLKVSLFFIEVTFKH